MRMQKLDRIFDRHDMIVLRLINQIDNRRQGRALARTGRAGYQHDAVLKLNNCFQLFWKVELFKTRRPVRYNAHDDGVSATLHEDVDAKTREAGGAVRNVGRAVLLEISGHGHVLSSSQLATNDNLGDACGVGRRQLFQTSNSTGLQFSQQFYLWRATGRKN